MNTDITSSNPVLVAAAGSRRSGSTWQFNALRYLFIRAGIPTLSAMHNGGWKKKVGAVKPPVAIVKIHGMDPDLRDRADLVFTARRDLRDMFASMVRRVLVSHPDDVATARSRISMYLREFGSWERLTDHETVFETMIEDKVREIRDIQEVIGVNFPQVLTADPIDVHEDVERLKLILRHKVDPHDQIWADHITDGRCGSYGETLTDETIEAIETEFGEWLEAHGYNVPGRTGVHG